MLISPLGESGEVKLTPFPPKFVAPARGWSALGGDPCLPAGTAPLAEIPPCQGGQINMNDRELLKKLNNLKDIKPDQAWKKNYRGILYSQISASRPVLAPQSNIRIVWQTIMPRQILISLAKPVWLASAASVLILVVGLGGVYASKNSKPGDSLYIAKIISEKAQFAMAFDEQDKAKLGVEFATNRAKEMVQILKDTDQTLETNNDKLEALSQNFKREIGQVKKRLTIIKAAKEQAKNDESQVFGANLGKSDQRMEIAEPAESTTEKPAAGGDIASTTKLISENQTITNATSTPETRASADQMLEQAEKLFDEKNLDETINKLEEVNKALSESGQVKGESEIASSTD
ncbi:hypothetical protein A3H09_01765 [Candidatus Falkowbacteria bacterium RIFCSPLOWO2_12_FULL_45_13]|uniref:DUF5667 domain-containing protein n=1 Tax=Candidatus Falkowbacteria bacterium RIFCSPLOWO2_12_FULL_45_13 TaxID=1797991 RepID=A0A1F5SVZ3_9BACT|nr:MAG: hypothetical protein A3H09_01765 [Candidatus Falkowbacteria bacterium RIFCSPLOWO2_12_FULL_45_13]